jgi:rhodanese-related sulfurtransferase/plastocyanin
MLALLVFPQTASAAEPAGGAPEHVPLISPQRLVELVQSGEKVLFLDVREPEEYAEGHIPGAVNLPERDFTKRVSEIPADALVIPYCNMDFRGFVAIQQLRALGVKRLALMQERGINGWRDQGLPIAGPETGLTEEFALARLKNLSPRELLGEKAITRMAATGVVHRIEMTASEWYFDPNDFDVEVGDEVRFSITSEKGNHFFVQPDYELAVVLPEGKTTEVAFVADRVGDFRFGSCEWDGGSLQVMKGRLQVKSSHQNQTH